MADELFKTDNDNQSQNGNDTKVTMSQADLDTLINSRFAKGAEKATKQLLETLGVESVDALKDAITQKKQLEEQSKTELEKALERINALESEKSSVLNEMNTFKQKAEVSSISVKYGVKDVEVFEMIYNTQQKGEDFNVENFINGLKESKPYLFIEQIKPRVDNSKNNNINPLDFATRVKQAKTQKELDALYKELQG